jgi:hypothetical protein
MQSKFEQLLDYLVNEETEKANELFHQIVVEKSRGIYESLISEEEDKDEDKEEDKDGQTDESYGMGEESVIEIGGDATDDLISDVEFGGDDMGDEGSEDEFGADEFGDEGEGDGTDARIDDLEDALADLKAEFEALMGDVDTDGDGDHDMDDHGGEEGDEMGDEEGDDDEEVIREYTEKVNGGFGAKIGGDNGQNAKSIVAGKNDMGGTAFKLGAGGDEKGGVKGGLLKPTAKEDNAGNVNKPGGTSAKQFYSKDGKGHGAEKKGSGESAGNTKSPLSPSHAK